MLVRHRHTNFSGVPDSQSCSLYIQVNSTGVCSPPKSDPVFTERSTHLVSQGAKHLEPRHAGALTQAATSDNACEKLLCNLS